MLQNLKKAVTFKIVKVEFLNSVILNTNKTYKHTLTNFSCDFLNKNTDRQAKQS